jgi:hypothetical protein
MPLAANGVQMAWARAPAHVNTARVRMARERNTLAVQEAFTGAAAP